MPTRLINGVRLYWEHQGDRGAPVVFVHGSWGDHHNWDAVAPAFAGAFRVFTYDRRGHSASERPTAQGSIEEDVADLAGFIDAHDLAPAHVAGNSYGAAIALKLAAKDERRFASLTVHEPPLLGMIQDNPMMPGVRQRLDAVLETLRTGDLASGARQFVETVALGPGAWDTLPPAMRETFVFNASTWLDEMNEPQSVMAVDLSRVAAFSRPVLISTGSQSPPFFHAIVERIATALPRGVRHTFLGAGHVPHLSHADEYVRVVGDFMRSVQAG